MTIIRKRGKNIKFTNLTIEPLPQKSTLIIEDPKCIPSSYILHIKPQKICDFEENVDYEHLNLDMLKYDPLISTPTPFVPTVSTSFSEKYSFLNPTTENDTQIDFERTKLLNPDSIWCWWCCHPFENKAFNLPIRKKNDGSLETIGTFCSPECICAYSMETGSKYGDKWEQIELLHTMMKLKEKISNAPPREQLAVFGGSLSCEEFRNYNKKKHAYIVYPPMISLKIHIDDMEEQEPTFNSENSSLYVDINNLNIEPFVEKPKKEKNRPSDKSNNKNTLDKFVDIKK